MIRIEATVKGVERAARYLVQERERSRKAFETALKVEAFNRLKQLRAEVRAGRPGGRPYLRPVLSALAAYTRTGRKRRSRVPLARLASRLRYEIKGAGTDNIQIGFGFVGVGGLRSILIRQQEGTQVRGISRAELGKRFARIGGRLEKKGDPDARFFFLRKSTRRFEVPQRDVIRTFWAAYKLDAMRQIRENYRRKMRGARI